MSKYKTYESEEEKTEFAKRVLDIIEKMQNSRYYDDYNLSLAFNDISNIISESMIGGIIEKIKGSQAIKRPDFERSETNIENIKKEIIEEYSLQDYRPVIN